MGAGCGGGVYLACGTFVMEGGEIVSNTATGYGGGVYVAADDPNCAQLGVPGNRFYKKPGAGRISGKRYYTVTGTSSRYALTPDPNGAANDKGSAFWIAGTGTYYYVGSYNDAAEGASGTYPAGEPPTEAKKPTGSNTTYKLNELSLQPTGEDVELRYPAGSTPP
jgi:hypothetical protein